MPRLKLTSAAVERLRPPAKGQVEYFDELLPSFGLRHSHAGTKAWFLMTRVDGRQIRVTVGRYPSLGLAGARKRSREMMRLADEGIDPRHVEQDRRHQKETEARNTFGLLAEEFMAKHVRPNLRISTAREYQRILFSTDTRAWRTRPIVSIQKRDILVLLEGVRARGTKSSAPLALAYLRKFFNWCADGDVINTPPTDRVRLERRARSRDRVLTLEELKLVWAAIDGEPGVFGALFKLLLLTGQRRGEVAGMIWDELRELDTAEPIWEIPGARTKNHRGHLVPLSLPAAKILCSLPRTSSFVFSLTGDTSVSGFSKARARVDRRVAELAKVCGISAVPDWTLHDLRRTMVTIMNERLAVAPHVVEAAVNHISGSVKSGLAGVYNRALYIAERRAALDKWAAYVSEKEIAKTRGRKRG